MSLLALAVPTDLRSISPAPHKKRWLSARSVEGKRLKRYFLSLVWVLAAVTAPLAEALLVPHVHPQAVILVGNKFCLTFVLSCSNPVGML